MSIQKLNEQLNSLIATRDALQLKKTKKALTADEQSILEQAIGGIVDLEEEIENAEKAEAQKDFANGAAVTAATGYQVPKGEEKSVHVEVSSVLAFDPATGREVTKPFIQKYSPKEWALVKKHQISLPYKFKVLYEPTSN